MKLAFEIIIYVMAINGIVFNLILWRFMSKTNLKVWKDIISAIYNKQQFFYYIIQDSIHQIGFINSDTYEENIELIDTMNHNLQQMIPEIQKMEERYHAEQVDQLKKDALG